MQRVAERAVIQSKLKIPAYPCHESGGIVWTYMGPKDRMTGFRDFGTEDLPREKWAARKQYEPMTWMQWMEGLMDTTHNSWLHHWKGRADIEDDGSDVPGTYNSNAAMQKFWGYDQAPDIRRRRAGTKVRERLAQFRLFDAYASYLRAMANQAPLVIALDDLHWADKPTLLLLRHLLRSATPMRLLVLATYRDTDLDRSHPLNEIKPSAPQGAKK